MSAPPFYAIDLVAMPDYAPPFIAIDLTVFSGAPTGEGVTFLGFSVAGEAVVPYLGSGIVTLEFEASGAGELPAAGSVPLDFSVNGAGIHGFVGQGATQIALSVSGTGYQDWLSLLPPISLQEVYRLVITGEADGLPDLHIGGISSWQATNQSGGRSSYLQAVIPAADSIIDDIADRRNGFLVIQKGYRTSDGSTRYEEILRSRFDNLRPDRGQRALTVTVSGYMPGRPLFSGSRTLTGIRSISTQNGKRRVRCDVDLFLQPGMTVEALGDSFVASFINYYVSDSDKFCEVGER